jgi:hypothetical protein
MNELVKACIHSKNGAIELVEILEYNKTKNRYVVKTQDKVICLAYYNPFNGYFYADDKFNIIK